MEFYQSDDKLKSEIWRVMQRHKGYDRRIARETLTFAVCRKVSKSYDRQVRDALSELPIVWDDGYYIPATREEAEGYIASMKSRQAAIGQRLRVLDQYLRTISEPVRVEQLEWLGVE